MFIDLKTEVHQHTNARELTLSLGGRWYQRYGAAPCPVCQPELRRDQNALTISDGAGRLLLNCKKTGCDFRLIMAAAGIVHGGYRRPSLAEMCRRKAEASVAAIKRSDAAKRVWAESQPIAGTLAEVYLRGRRISCDLPDTLRFHPSCYHGPSQSALPAMVALVEGSESFAIHRTFLRADGRGKAGLPSGDKLMLGSVAGGAVRLSKAAGRLVVAEGIETALSLASGLLPKPATVWASLSTSGLRSLRLPELTGQLTIATDPDAEGRKASRTLARHAVELGWQVTILDPLEGRDFNDLLQGQEDVA
jgi:hypothetical protein